MARRLALALLSLALVVVAPALAGNIRSQKASVDSRLTHVRAQIAQSKKQEAQLGSEIDALSSRIDALETKVGDVSGQLAALQSDLALRRQRLGKLDELYGLQTARFRTLRHEYAVAVRRLETRLVSIYEQGQPTTIDVVLAARSFKDVLDQIDYLGAIAVQDKRVANEVASAKSRVLAARSRTRTMRRGVQAEARVIQGRVQQEAILRAQLVSSRTTLASARAGKSHALAATRSQIQQEISESQALAASSAALEAQIKAAEAAARARAAGATGETSPAPTATPEGAPHFIWPVSGPITSPFGMRWGTLHPGIDIGVPTGTPIKAAAAGQVVYCGWMSGYGNLVVIDHGGGYATAYGHQSQIAVSCGQDVAQGQTIGYVGCTGFCTGPHLHFEVRVNGSPVDPLQYLG